MFNKDAAWSTQSFVVISVMSAACLIGASIPAYVGAMGDSATRLIALPTLFLLCFLFAFNRRHLLLLFILSRASADLLFESTKLTVGQYQIGVGGLINVFAIVIAILLVLERPHLVPKRMVCQLWAAFLITAIFGVGNAPIKADAIRIYLSLLSYFAIFVSAFYFVRSTLDFRFCVRIVLWSSVIPAIYALLDIGLHMPAAGLGGYRLQSTFTHPNILAFYLVLTISLALYLLKTAVGVAPAWKRIGLTSYTLYLLLLLVLTQTRSAWVACFALFALYGIFFERRYLLYMVAVPFLALLVPSVQDRLLDLGAKNPYNQFAKIDSFAWRLLIWETGLRWMRPENYFLGYGIDSFRYFSQSFFPLAGKTNPGAHSVYVQWLFEVGIAGLLSLTWLFGRLLWWLKSMLPIDKLGAFIAMSLVAEYLIVSFSDNLTYYLAFNWYFWFIVGAACAVASIDARNRRPEAQEQLRPNPFIHRSVGQI